MHNKVLFIHIPKTGGVSIGNFLSQNKMDNWKREYIFNHHDPLFLLEAKNDLSNTFIFSVVRNPYTRIFSHYQNTKNAKRINLSFNEFLRYIRYNGNVFLVPAFYPALPLVWYNQSFYLHNNNGQMAVNKIYRFEALSEFETDFNTKLAVKNVGRYTKQDYLSCYTQQNINLVKQIYFEDFVRFEYSNNFDDSTSLVKE